jgi:hypothetical protein
LNHSPIFLVSILAISVYYLTMTTSDHSSVVPIADADEVDRSFHFKYTVQKGYFQQSEDSTDDQKFDFVGPCPFLLYPLVSPMRTDQK